MAIIGGEYLGRVFRKMKQEYIDFNQLSPEEVGRLFKINATPFNMQKKIIQDGPDKQEVGIVEKIQVLTTIV